MKNTQLQTLQKHLDEINKSVSEIKNEIDSIDVAVDSNDISKLFSVSFVMNRYKDLPGKIVPYLPKFAFGRIQGEELRKFFGSLSSSSSTLYKHGYRMTTRQKSPETGSSPPIKQLLDEPEIATTIDTGYGYLYNVACLNDENIWTSGEDSTMKLFSINQGSLLKSITTKSGNAKSNIAVTKGGDLVYTDTNDRTVNIVKNEKIEEAISLQEWRPKGVCSTSSGDLLVIMDSKDDKQTKVVRYSGSIEKQTIQFDDEGKPLYSPSYRYLRNVTENKNLDICVADDGTGVIVVVNQNKPFYPRGITTDSQSRILTADMNNDCVHIIDQDGQFLRYLDCGLTEPWGLCTDTNDNLFIAQWENKQVKKIKYLTVMMDPRTSAREVMRCDLCETAVVQMHCDTCLVNLCKACVGEHASADLSKPHKIVDFKYRKSTMFYPACRSHDKELCEMFCKQCDILLQTLQKHLEEIYENISEIKSEIESIEVAMDSNDISKLFSVTSDMNRLRNLPEKIVLSLPTFTSGKIQGEEFSNLFGALSSSSLTDKHGYVYSMKTTQKLPEAGSSPPVKQLLDEPETVTTIVTVYGLLYNVACLSDKEIWTSGQDSTMELYRINEGSLLKSIKTTSGGIPSSLSVTKRGDLVCTDYKKRTVNIVKNDEIEEVIRLQNWEPNGACSTSSGKPIFSPYLCYITENRNLDICVSDNGAKAVVVFNSAGKLIFRYTGHTSAASFNPQGITTDSQSHILIADISSHWVHIIDQNGQFLRYIECGLSWPWGLCTDTNDNLFVAQRGRKQLKQKEVKNTKDSQESAVLHVALTEELSGLRNRISEMKQNTSKVISKLKKPTDAAKLTEQNPTVVDISERLKA
ncbi:uncharacterized protein LOC134259189 [Saccostrea cucullata]|uniref:uncharacterized protein LOC134259189 n=1 Tax=Saccostrea cuccullata TaxID=36930 RepID=UPI002ED13E7F